jgi:hypothetical protein
MQGMTQFNSIPIQFNQNLPTFNSIRRLQMSFNPIRFYTQFNLIDQFCLLFSRFFQASIPSFKSFLPTYYKYNGKRTFPTPDAHRRHSRRRSNRASASQALSDTLSPTEPFRGASLS